MSLEGDPVRTVDRWVTANAQHRTNETLVRRTSPKPWRRMSERDLRWWRAAFGVVAAALTVVLKLLELADHIPPVNWAGPPLGWAEVVVLGYLIGYIGFDLYDLYRFESHGWHIALGLSLGAVAAWAFATFGKSSLALGYLACYALHDGLDAAYYGWFDRTLGPFPGWGWVLVSAVVAFAGVVALAWSWGALVA